MVQKSLEVFQTIADRLGEAASYHQLGSVDLEEGDYESARENFQKSLEIRQAIGDLAGEAATLYQIGYLAFQFGCLETAFLLLAACCDLENSMGHVGVAETLDGLFQLAQYMKLDQAALAQRKNEAAEHYRRDRCASLVRDAFAAVDDGKS